MHKAYIGIGSNLQQPMQQIRRAIAALQLLSVDNEIICSSIYQSTAMGNAEQADYLNAVACVKTNKPALDLLDALQKIETAQGRERTEERWGSRTLDLDLLLYDEKIINHSRLTVPHYGLRQRNFVIYPLMDVAADLILPDGTSVRALYQSCSSTGIRKID